MPSSDFREALVTAKEEMTLDLIARIVTEEFSEAEVRAFIERLQALQ